MVSDSFCNIIVGDKVVYRNSLIGCVSDIDEDYNTYEVDFFTVSDSEGDTRFWCEEKDLRRLSRR